MEETIQQEKPTVILEAQQAAERLEKANFESREIVKQMERLEAFRALGGKTEIAQLEKKEESPVEYVRRVMSNDRR